VIKVFKGLRVLLDRRVFKEYKGQPVLLDSKVFQELHLELEQLVILERKETLVQLVSLALLV
jgi:hypothetical protein